MSIKSDKPEVQNIFKEDKPIVSIKEARKVLGKKYEFLTDEEISALIKEMNIFINLLIEDGTIFRLKS
jgi:uncharacterized protein YjgD (DUF1641 family)